MVMVAAFGFDGTNAVQFALPYYSSVLPGSEVCRLRLRLGAGSRYEFGTPTSLLFRSDIVRSRHAFYNESNLHADAEVCFEFLEGHDFGFVHQVLMFIRRHEESMTSASKRFNTYLPEALYNLVKYGPKYLEEEELKYRIREYVKPTTDSWGGRPTTDAATSFGVTTAESLPSWATPSAQNGSLARRFPTP